MSAYSEWRANGAKWQLAKPVADLAARLRGYGYTVGTIGDTRHLTARLAEDHTPYSRTGWPVPAPYGWVLACDVMPKSGLPSLADLARQIVVDRHAGIAGTLWIKYVNWTDRAGDCWHDAWQPTHERRRSGDRGHIHISCRSDAVRSTVAAMYDPVARLASGGSKPAPGAVAPPFPGRVLVYRKGDKLMTGADVVQYQSQMKRRGWRIDVDGKYGEDSADVTRRFQREKGLDDDGKVGPRTWSAAWSAPVT